MCARNNSNNIPAFTLMEVVVSMAITASIIGIVFVIIDIMSGRLRDFRAQNEPVAELSRFTYATNRNIARARAIHLSGSEARFILLDGDTATMRFTAPYAVLSHSRLRDTFHVEIKGFKLDTLITTQPLGSWQVLRINTILDKPAVLSFYRRIYPDELLNMPAI